MAKPSISVKDREGERGDERNFPVKSDECFMIAARAEVFLGPQEAD